MSEVQTNSPRVLSWFRRIGQALMLPAALAPIAGLLVVAGDLLGQRGFSYASVLADSGFTLIEQFPLLIAVSLAFTLAVEQQAVAALSGAIAYILLTRSGAALFVILGNGTTELADFQMGLAGGFAAGLLAAVLHNGLKSIKIPALLDFFNGQRSVQLWRALTTYLAAFVAGILSGALWSLIWKGLTTFAGRLPEADMAGAFVYGLLNRLLVPFGLHHVLNNEIWFNYGEYTSLSGILIRGDLNRFLAGDPTAGHYIAGFYPMMIFAVPAIALAFLITARRNRRWRVAILLVLAGLVSLVSGVAEPVEFLILFSAPVLYVLYAVLYGLSMLVCFQLQALSGFNFSTGLTDYLANWNKSTHPEAIWQVGIVMAVLAFAIFYFAVTLLKMRTPGREAEPEPKSAPQPEPQTEAVADPAPDTETGITPEPVPEPEPKTRRKPRSKPKPEPKEDKID